MKALLVMALCLAACKLSADSVALNLMGNMGGDGAPGPGVGVEYIRSLNEGIGYGFKADWLSRQEEKITSNTDISTYSGSTLTLLAAGQGTIRPWKNCAFNVLAGIGAGMSRLLFRQKPSAGYTWANGSAEDVVLIDSSAWSLAANLTVGFDYRVTELLSVGFGIGYTKLGATTYDVTPEGRKVDDRSSITWLPSVVSAGLRAVLEI